MSILRYTASTQSASARQSAPKEGEVSTDAPVSIEFLPDDMLVVFGDHILPMHRFSELDDEGIAYVAVIGKTWEYDIWLREDHVEITRHKLSHSSDGTPSISVDTWKYSSMVSFMSFVVDQLVPDCEHSPK